MQLKFARDSPVIRSSMTSIVKQFEGSKGSVHASFEAQRSIPEVVPSPLIQEHHLGHNTGSRCLLTLFSLIFCSCDNCGRLFGPAHLDDVAMEEKEKV